MGYSLSPLRESKFQKNMREAYEAEGCVVLKLDPRASAIPKGFPDLLVIGHNGEVTFIEAKSATGVVEPAQKYWHDLLRKMGHNVQVVKA